ncbi:TetR/AcrR family transcriptional regulator [Shewanella avicenniae]|uniref:TetR/AcrR family transcriptional regulator n=1 Tax=Shewanella avicenniae TaxID=2814294 RepID=A0ABX7QTJ7_9GAMM|nr:TetR family transcriptional regulator [Shewanella avicenniae]QSX34803.1 TetR/AcrR family transcriptional regulator [Shewanella avicenniae]
MTDTPSTAPRRRGRRHSNEISGREALLSSAIKAFAQHGYEAASLRTIASGADVDVALCARLFGNKAKLWQAVLDTVADEFEQKHRATFEAINQLADSQPYQAMYQFIEFHTRFTIEHPDLSAFMLQEATMNAERTKVIQQQVIKPMQQPMLAVVAKAKAAGVIDYHDPSLFLRMLVAAIVFPLTVPEVSPSAHSQPLQQRIVAEVSNIYLRQPITQ